MLRRLVALALAAAAVLAQERAPLAAPGIPAVRLSDGYWAPRIARVRAVTLPHCFAQCEKTGRFANFDAAAARKGEPKGYFFDDSDVYKTLEAVGLVLEGGRDPELEARADLAIGRIAAAQEEDGYLYTHRTIGNEKKRPPGGEKRWSDLGSGHELYCAGHLYEAAVAYHRATGKTTLLDVAKKHADLVDRTFGPGKLAIPDGHPEVELALAKLADHTGDKRYAALAKFFVDARGRATDGRGLFGEYAQDHAPVLETKEIVGHAVRAAYLYAGVADVARQGGGAAYLDASRRLWDDLYSSQVYLTGGIGAQGNNEGFGVKFELANTSAYNETCAAIANALWSHRLFLATGEGRYVDAVERVLLNAFHSGWGLSGDRFFYPNPLESRGGVRAEWFGCACCPPNVARFVASVPTYAYATGPGALYWNLAVAGTADLAVDGAKVSLAQTGDGPFGGKAALTFSAAPEKPFALMVRIPGWARGEPLPGGLYGYADKTDAAPRLAVNGAAVVARAENGFVRIERAWKAGDVVSLDLPMPVRRVVADPRIAANRGAVALMRGPFVYGFEGIDQPTPDVRAFVLDAAPFSAEERRDLLGGVVVLKGRARKAERGADGAVVLGEPFDVAAVPYFAWANRARTPMAVWMAAEPSAAKPAPAKTLARSAKASASFGGDLDALSDQAEPKSSIDHDHPYCHWWPKKGGDEWIQYAFDGPKNVSAVEVYWFDDTGRGECKVPASWKLRAEVDGAWTDVETTDAYGVAKDRYHRVAFKPVKATALRLEIKSQQGWSGGVHEWRVEAAPAAAAPTPAPAPPAGGGENALRNGSFEVPHDTGPLHWTKSLYGGSVSFAYPGKGRTDEHSAMISSETGADAAWSTRVEVFPRSKYRLSGWIRTEGVAASAGGRGAQFNVHNLQEVRTDAVAGTSDWTRVETVFDTRDEEALTINALFGGWGLSTGRAWFDDVALELLEKGEIPAPTIAVDAAKVGEPISQYVYGQFIEHLGRCIYGGIWAEMLDDRKFFRAVGAPESPWKARGAVTMNPVVPFVGDHTPVVAPAGDGKAAGIAQGGLAVRKGKQYVGYAWLMGDPEAAPVEIALEGGGGRVVHVVPVLGDAYAKVAFAFEAAADSDDATLSLTSKGGGQFRVGTASLMPADHVEGMRPDVLALLRELNSPIYRWPGGNFVSGYDWRDGIGDRDRRPPRKNPAWTGIEHNDFGLDEFMAFCRVLGTEPLMVVNTGQGDVPTAVAMLQYANGKADTPYGAQRAKNGRVEPYGVAYWGIGNEMYGSWQLGNVPLDQYARRHNRFVDAMRKEDPTIKPIGVGALGGWSERMLAECGERMTLLSEHVYWQDREGLAAHVRQPIDTLERIAAEHRKYRERIPGLKARDIRICQDEWNYWYGPEVFGELGTRYFQKDAVGCAAALHVFAKHSDLYFMANYAQTVNVIGAIKASRTAAALETTGLVLKLYRAKFGTLPAATTTTGLVNAQAAWTADRKALTLGVVNPTLGRLKIAASFAGAALGAGTKSEIASDDPLAYNDPDRAPTVTIKESPAAAPDGTLDVAPCSVTLFVWPVR
jgi:DUF1680 family protein/alpha-L-arabinofuranosidase